MFLLFFTKKINLQVRPIFDVLNNASSKWFKMDGKYSVDEMMVPYFGRHSSKQFIRGKPIRYGFKIWALCSSTGAGVWYEPYCGRDTEISDAGLGQGPNVVIDLVSKAQLAEGSEIFMDNLFTSFPLLDRLSEMGIAGTGTVRQNRLHRIPIMGKKEVEKKTVARGFSQTVYRNDQVLCVWKDNKPVYMASNKYSSDSNLTCKRFCREQKSSIQVPIPVMVTEYNSHMGGVDLLDNMVAFYR
jgi:DNA excision repair protein ERCC-6